MTRDLTHELSTSDRFGEFRSLFRMPLAKIEELTDILINREYIKVPRSHKFRATGFHPVRDKKVEKNPSLVLTYGSVEP